MSIESLMPLLQAAIRQRLGVKKHLKSAGLLEKLGRDTGMHPQDVRRGLGRLKQSGWLDGVAVNGEPIGDLVVLERPPVVEEPSSLSTWKAALEKSDLSTEDRACLEDLHALLAGFEGDVLIRIANGMLRLRDECSIHHTDPQYLVSARHLLGSSKLLSAMPASLLRKFVGREPAWTEQIPYIVTAGPQSPASVILIENPWAFERAIELGLGDRHALVVTFGYGLSRNGEAFGRQLAQQIETDRTRLIQLKRHGQPPDLESLFRHEQLTFWGDLDPEGLRIYMRLKRRLPGLTLSRLYEPMRLRLMASGGHPYHRATGKEGQRPVSPAELQNFPEIGPLAKACERHGLDQEALSLDDFTSHL